MFRSLVFMDSLSKSFPRIRGDVPIQNKHQGDNRWFSPHTRGCSRLLTALGSGHTVFPAYAGMFRPGTFATPTWVGFPRIRGDVPTHTEWVPLSHWVFPAYAGMFRRGSQAARLCFGFPRIRGDVPDCDALSKATKAFSPHTRGCSFRHHQAN